MITIKLKIIRLIISLIVHFYLSIYYQLCITGPSHTRPMWQVGGLTLWEASNVLQVWEWPKIGESKDGEYNNNLDINKNANTILPWSRCPDPSWTNQRCLGWFNTERWLEMLCSDNITLYPLSFCLITVKGRTLAHVRLPNMLCFHFCIKKCQVVMTIRVCTL